MSSVEFRFLKIAQPEAGVALVSLARAPANAVNDEMYVELARFFSDPDSFATGVRVIVLTGDGPHFCAGNDLDEFATMTPENGSERMWRVREAFFAIEDCPVPVIGAVQGTALGTGLAIAASCDFVLAAEDAKFGVPELTVGVMGGAAHLSRLAAAPIVRRMYFTGTPISARELASWGAALFPVPAADLIGEATKLARRTATFSPTAVRLAKRILNQVERMGTHEGYPIEQRYTVEMSGHPDSKEALAAFRDRRPPSYQPYAPRRAGDF